MPIVAEVRRAPLRQWSWKSTTLVLAALFLLQTVVLWPVTLEFFTPDGIFYLSRQLEDWNDVQTAFTNLDDVPNYRPLTVVVATTLSWFWGLNPFPYHLFTLLTHLLITSLIFWLARLLLQSDLSALVAAAFFGLHSTAARVAFGIAFLCDLLYAGFFIFAVIGFTKFEQTGRRGWRIVSLLSFILSLFSKEPAVTLPAVLFAGLMFVPAMGADSHGRRFTWRQALRETLPFWVLSFAYVIWWAFLTAGLFIPTEPGHPYHVTLTWNDFLKKARYLEWALNVDAAFDTMAGHPSIAALASRILPPSLAESFRQTSDFWLYLFGPVWMLWLVLKGEWFVLKNVGFYALATPAMTIATGIFLRNLVRNKGNNGRIPVYGICFFLVVLLPVLPLPADKTMLHNLYVPVAGLAFAMGYFVRSRLETLGGAFKMCVTLAVPLVLTLGGVHYIVVGIESGWPTVTARAANGYLEDIQQHYPNLPKGAVLFFEPTGDNEWPFLTGGGELFRVFYNDPTLVTLYGDYEQRIPPGAETQKALFRFRERDGSLIPVDNGSE